MLTQATVGELLSRRGWIVEASGHYKFHPVLGHGLAIHATSPNGYVLSVQGGHGMYSDPPTVAEAYATAELAVYAEVPYPEEPSALMTRYMHTSLNHGEHNDVIAYAQLHEIAIVVAEVESWPAAPAGPVFVLGSSTDCEDRTAEYAAMVATREATIELIIALGRMIGLED